MLLIGGQCFNADLYECEELSPCSVEESEGGQSTLSSRRVRQDDIVSTTVHWRQSVSDEVL